MSSKLRLGLHYEMNTVPLRLFLTPSLFVSLPSFRIHNSRLPRRKTVADQSNTGTRTPRRKTMTDQSSTGAVGVDKYQNIFQGIVDARPNYAQQ